MKQTQPSNGVSQIPNSVASKAANKLPKSAPSILLLGLILGASPRLKSLPLNNLLHKYCAISLNWLANNTNNKRNTKNITRNRKN